MITRIKRVPALSQTVSEGFLGRTSPLERGAECLLRLIEGSARKAPDSVQVNSASIVRTVIALITIDTGSSTALSKSPGSQSVTIGG